MFRAARNIGPATDKIGHHAQATHQAVSRPVDRPVVALVHHVQSFPDRVRSPRGLLERPGNPRQPSDPATIDADPAESVKQVPTCC